MFSINMFFNIFLKGHQLMLPAAKEIDQILYDYIAKAGTTYDLNS